MNPTRRSGSARPLSLWALVLALLAPPAFVALSSAEPGRGPGRSAPVDVAAASPAVPDLAPPHHATPGPAAEPAPPRRIVTEAVLGRGQTIASILRAKGIDPAIATQVAREMRGTFDFRNARPGHGFRLVQDASGAMVEFAYRISSTEAYVLRRDGHGFRVSREHAALEPRAARLAGIITSTLYQAVTDLGEDGQLARDFAEIFAWDVDFQRSVQPGDAFQILYERLYRHEDGEDVYVRPGRILAARYEGSSGTHTAVYFESREGRGGYYRPDGTSVEGAFLMSPLRHGRITSRYSNARFHPILKITRPHHGIDYAAPTGTPVWSVADGKVIYRGWGGDFGNLVKVQHRNGYVSYYAHLSRFAKGLRVGDPVEQKQVVGFVGQTGLATGPHVCFRIQKNGRYVNPTTLRTPSGDPIPAALQPAFDASRDLLLAEFHERRQIAELAPRPGSR